MIDFDYAGQDVLITGGTRGIGGALSKAFLAAGANVIATFRQNHEGALAFKDGLGEAAERCEIVQLDVTDYDAVDAFFATVFQQSGRKLDVLVNNAGVRDDAVVGMMPPSAWSRVLETNLTGAYNMSKFAIQLMMGARYGRIINMSSPSGELGFAGQANYAASKGGLEAFTRSLAKEAAKRGITVNCVSPGFVNTDLIADLGDKQRKAYEQMVPLRRFAEVEEISPSVLFLASENSGYITGSVLKVAGGL
jgi:3-oxoacyl-[acyl-carrier protein] reductase